MDQSYLWIVVGLGVLALFAAGLGLLVRVHRRTRYPESGDEERLPMTPLETRALWGLLIGLVVIAGIVAVFVRKGATAYYDDPEMRVHVYGLFLGGLLVYAVLLLATRRGRGGEPFLLDERDRRVLRLAPRIQLPAVLVCVMAWAIALTEMYWEERAIPIVYPYLIAMSAVIVAIVAQSAGILVGYWWISNHAEG